MKAKKRRKAREWDVYVSKHFDQLMPHDENRFCGDKSCCELILLREVLPRRRRLASATANRARKEKR